MLRRFLISSWVLVGVACGGETMNDGNPPGGGGTVAAGGSATSGGTGGSAGSAPGGAGGASGAGGGDCVQKGDGWPTGTEATCSDLSVLAVDSPVISDAGGDGVVSPGEAFDLQVVLREVAGIGFGWYPGVKFDSSHAGVTLSETDWFYGIFGCQSYDVGAQGKVDASVKPGTVVMLTARAAMLNTECPAAPALQVTLTVK